MKSRKNFPLVVIIWSIGLALAMVLVPAWRVSRAAVQPNAQVAIREAWQRAEKVGAYRFSTDIEQTTYPAPLVANVGRSSHTETYHLDGVVNRREESLSLTLWQNGGNVLTGQDGFEIRVRDGKAYGRAIGGGAWQEIDDFNGTFAPGNDPLAYLAGAKDLRLLSPEDAPEGVQIYAFDLDGPAFASYLRARLEDQLRRSGELPPGLSLDTPRTYRAMNGDGELWLDADGLPLRLQMDIAFPDPQSGERITADIRTDFSGFQEEAVQGLAFWQNPGGWITAALHLPPSPRGWVRLFPKIGQGLLGFALLMLFVHYRHTRHAYAAFASVIVFSMVVSPLLHSYQVSAYYDRQEARQEQAAENEQVRQAQEVALASNWNPHQNPLESSQGTAVSGQSSAASSQASTSLTPNSLSPNPDSDLDGLSDEIEINVLHTLPEESDSDGDGLDDGVEVLRLGTNPLRADTDGDGIPDAREVRGFRYNQQNWTLDPNAADTNSDGRIDTLECPGMVDGKDLTCLDQDADGIPDAFDRDDDGDGLADSIDLYPDGLVDRDGLKTNGLNPAYFDGSQPFEFKLQSLADDTPVLVDFQLVPENPAHLTYALNVLDWPGSDTDGQVQHVKDTTFAEGMSAAQIQASPSAAYGDMRLVPMLEIVMPGNQVPLPLTTPAITLPLTAQIGGQVRLTPNAADSDKTDLAFSFDDPTAAYTAKIYAGGCPVSGAPAGIFNGLHDGDTATFDGHIVDLADGAHALTLSDGTEGDCLSLGNIVNGPYHDRMVDPAPLRPYGISVREVNQNGKLAAYLPLSMVPDETGYGRVAFQARMFYQAGQGAQWRKAQQVRLVWMVQMLTDACDTSGFTSIVGEDPASADARMKTWCAAPEHRTPDGFQVVQTYDDAWALTGFSVREDHGLDTAIVYEDPAQGDLVNSENLWQAAYGLSAAFLSGRDADGDGCRDVSVYAYDAQHTRLGNTTLYNRLDADGNIPDGDEQRWGIPKGALQVARARYPHQDYSAYQAMHVTPDVLVQFPQDTVPTLLFAREEHFRSAALADLSLQNGVFRLDLGGSRPLETVTGLRWMPYRYNSSTGSDGQVIGWEPFPAAEYWDTLELQYRDLFAALDPDNADIEEASLGQALVARSHYFSLLQGLAQEVQQGSDLLWTPDPAGDGDAQLIVGLSIGYGKKIESLVYSITTDFLEEYGRGLFAEVAFDRLNNAHITWYEEVHGFWYSIGKSIKANTVGPWVSLFSGGFKTRLAGGLTLAGGVAVLGLTLFGVSQAGSGGEAAQIALSGLGVVMALKSMASMVASVTSSVEKYGSFSAAMRGTAESIAANARSSISKAAVVGLIIGVVITWGTVAVMLGLQAGAGGVSGTAVANAIAGAVASTIVAIIMFAIAAIPLVGAIITAVVGLIDALVSMLCTIFVPENQSDHPAVDWFCGGITGLVTKAFQVLIYSGHQMVEMNPENSSRLEFSNFETDDLVHPDWGIRQGNSIRYGVSLTNTIDIAPLPDDLGAAYRYQYNDKVLRSATFDYQLTYTNTTEIHEGLQRFTLSNEWAYADGDGPVWGDFGHTWRAAEPVYVERDLKSKGLELTQAGINVPAALYLIEGYAIPSQNCILGVCTIWTERDSRPYDLGSAIILDVFPATLTDFYQLAAKEGGYALAWGQEGDAAFPRLTDADGDGIPYTTDQHDNAWDNDGDRLSDGDEARLGTDPNNADSDGDGLRDDLELLAGTNPLRPDSDGDGLVDGQEVFHQDIFDQDGDGDTAEWLGGWLFTYDLDAGGAPLETRVFSSPLNADSDGDTLTDAQEKVYGFNPQMPSNPRVLTFESTVYERDGNTPTPSDGFVRPGDSIFYDAALSNELYNRWMHGLLETDIPTSLSGSSIDPVSFLLYPQETQTISGTVQVDSVAPAGVYSLTQRAGALITDWREISQGASLWYPFEDTATAVTFADRSGSIPAHDGTCSNPVSGAGCVPVKNDGVFGGALRLNGSAYLTANYDPANEGFALSLWFKTGHADGALFASLGNNILDRQIYLENGQIKVELRKGGRIQTLTSPDTYDDGQWHHLVHTFGTALNGQRLYLDGLLVASGNLSRVKPAANAQISIGGGIPTMGNFNGKLDDLRLYEKVLSQREVATLFDAPVLDLRFDSDAHWKDSSPFKNNAACTGGNCPAHASGIDGGAAKFNGFTYLTASGESLDLSQGGFTLGAWIYPTRTPRACTARVYDSFECQADEPQPQGILGFGTGGRNAYPSLQRVGLKLRFTFGGLPYFTTGDVLQTNRWNHVAVTFDGSAVRIYVNGALAAQDASTFAGQAPPNNTLLSIGRTGDHAALKAGKIRLEWIGEGESTANLCLAFRPQNGKWVSLLDRDIAELPIRDEVIGTQAAFSGSGTLLLWENDMAPRCITAANEWNDNPVNGTDDFLYTDVFQTTAVSEGLDGPYDQNYAIFDFYGQARGRIFYTYENDSIPFYGRIDEVQVYNRPLDEAAIAGMVQAHRLALALPFDDAPGTTAFADASFSPQQAVCDGEACPTAGLPGRVNQAALFDGNDALNLGKSELNQLTGELTLAAWVRPDDLTGLQWIAASARTHSADGYGLALDGDGLRFQAFGVQTYAYPNAGLVPGEWTHIAAVLDADHNVSFYVNGALAYFVSGGADVNADGDDLFLVGAGTNAGSAARRDFFHGALDDLQIYSEALGESAVQNLYQRAPQVQLHLDEGASLGGDSYAFPDAANSAYAADCQGATCPQFGDDIDGQLQTAVAFNQTADSLVYPYRPALDSWDFSLSLWVYPAEVNAKWQTLVVRGGHAGGVYGLFIQPDSMTPVFAYCGQTLAADQALVQNTWNHLAAVRDGNKMRIYLNGQLQGALTASLTCWNSTDLTLGGAFAEGDSAAFSGRLDEVNFYTRPLGDDEIVAAFAYQSKWVEERQSHAVIVDDDLPAVSLTTTGENLPLADVQMLITASDPTSGIATVEFGLRAPGESGYTWQSAPPCQDALDGTAWCPTFVPALPGAYRLRARVTDKVGHVSTDTHTVTVEDAPPTGSFAFAPDALLVPLPAQDTPNTWVLALSGTVSDPAGVDADSLALTLLDADGLLVPPGAQRPTLNDETWSLGYEIRDPQPGGRYTLRLTARDTVGARPGLDETQQARHTLLLEQPLQLDALPPIPALGSSLPDLLGSGQTLTGTVREAPSASAVSGVTGVETAFLSALPGSTEHLGELLPGGLLHLPLDESAASTERLVFRDISGMGFEGVCGGSCPAPSQAGHTGNAVFFDGLVAEIRVPQGQDLGDRNQVSIALWLRPEGASEGTFFYKAGELALRRDYPDGQIFYQLGNTAPGWGTWTPSGITVPAGTWSYFALTYDGSQVQTYLNGIWEAAQPASGALPNQSGLLLGADENGNRFRGLLDEVRVYDHALSGAELRDLYLGDGPVLHLTFEDNWLSDGMTLADASVWGQHGMFSTGEAHNKAVTGAVGAYALRFDGADDYALLPDSPALDLAQFSLSLWLNPTLEQSTAFHTLLVKGDVANQRVNYGLYLDQQSGNLSLGIGNAACAAVTYFPFGLNLTPGNWTHIAAAYDGAQVTLYLNGQEVRREAYTGGVCQNDEPLRVAQSLNGGFFPAYRGLLDDLFISPRALTGREVNTLYARGWQPALTTPTGPGVTQADWQAQVPDNLEGVYRLDLRAWDVGGRVSLPQTAWQGEVDTLAPRLTLTGTLAGDSVRYTAVAEDFNLALDGLVTPCGAAADPEERTFQAAWYRALFPDLARTDGLTAFCERPASDLPGEVGAADTPGLARGVVVSGTLAYLADGAGGLQIVDFGNPGWPQIVGADSTNYTSDVAAAPGGAVLPPDLTVTSLEASPASPEVGAGFNLSVTVQNQGAGRVYAVSVSLYQDEQPTPCVPGLSPWTETIPSLDAGQSVTVTFAHPGLSDWLPHDFYAQVDPDCAIIESDESNNIFGPSTVTAVQPDLTIESLTVAPSVIYAGQPVTVTAVVRNLGTGVAENFRTALYTDTVSAACSDPGWVFTDTAQLLPGEALTLTFTHPGFDEGPHNFLSVTDSECSVSENDENNNAASANFTVQAAPAPDLAVTAIQVSNPTPFISETVDLTVTVENIGPAAAGAFDLAVFADITPSPCDQVNAWDVTRISGGLAPGASTQVTFTYGSFSSAGTHTLAAQADNACEITPENDESNNTLVQYVNVIDPNQPDLVFESLAVPPSVVVSTTYVVTATVTNQGPVPADTPWGVIDLGVYLDHQPTVCEEAADAYAAYNGAIAAGETVVLTVTMPGAASAGAHDLYGFMDWACAVSESEESNNFFGPQPLTVTVSALVSLTPSPSPKGRGGSSLSPTSLPPFDQAQGKGGEGELPSPPTHLPLGEGSLPLSGEAASFYAFTASADGLHIFDVSAPDIPVEVGALALPGLPRGVALQGDTAYLSTQFNGLHAVDVGNPGYPGLLDNLPLPGRGEGLAVAGENAFVAAGTAGLQIVGIHDPAALALVGSYDTPGYAYAIALTGTLALVADGGAGLQILDISNPAEPQFVGALDTNALVSDVAVAGSTAYLADGTGGLQVVDISDPAAPALLCTFDTPGSAEGVALGGGFALVADFDGGLRVINPAGQTPQATACDLAGNCASATMTQSFAVLAAAARQADPATIIRYASAAPLTVGFSSPSSVLDSQAPITVTGYASATVSTLDVITVTVDGAPLSVTSWQSGTTYSNWQAAWTPPADGRYLLRAEVRAADGSTVSDTLTVTVDTIPPTVVVSPTLYVGADYFEPRSINLRGAVSDIGGVTQVEVLGLDGVWRKASLHGDAWNIPWGLATTRLPDNETRSVQVRATDIAGHTTTVDEIITVDALPPAPMTLTLTANGVPVQDGDLLPVPLANLTLSWTPSADGSGLAPAYRVRWAAQVTDTVSQTWQNIPAGGTLAADFTAYDGQRISVGVGITDTAGNQRWQEWGSLLVDSPLTPDFLLPPSPEWGRAGDEGENCSCLGADRRPKMRIYGGETQSLYATWNRETLRLAWLGGDWDGDGDLFLYFDTTAGGTNTAYNPFGGAESVALPEGLLADALVWVQGRAQAQLFRWDGSQWAGGYRSPSTVYRPSSSLTALFLPFTDLGLTPGAPFSLVGFATEEGALRLWAALPGDNPLDSGLLNGVEPVGANLTLLHAYHWDAAGDGVCPNAAYPDADVQSALAAVPSGVGYTLLGDGLYWMQNTLLNDPPADLTSQIPSLNGVQPPQPNGTVLTYTLTLHNRGTVTATGLTAVLTPSFALQLLDGNPDGQSRALGDLSPGETFTYTFRAQVDTGRSDESWARLAVRLYDDVHPETGAALEYLWLDTPVDNLGPRFVGLEQPVYLLGPGENLLRGYAYDDSGVTAVDVEIQSAGGTETLTCPPDDPQSGNWACLWDAAGLDGQPLSLRMRGVDTHGQAGTWGQPYALLLDTRPPTLTLDISTTQTLSGSIVNDLRLSLYGEVADEGGLGSVDVCLEGDCQPANLLLEAGEASVWMEDAPEGGIPIDSASTCGGGEILRTFTVTETFPVRDVQVGLAIQHARRDDLRVTLTAPSGISVTLLRDDGVSGTNFANADFWLRDAARQDFAAVGEARLQPPYYASLSRPADPLHALTGIPAAGTWTLAICDTNPGADDGTYLSSALLLTPPDTAAKRGRWSSSLASGGQALDYVPQDVAVFGEDVVGNRTGMTLTVTVDNVPPVITVTQALSRAYLNGSGRVLSGTVHDGGPDVTVWVDVQQPDGNAYRRRAARVGDAWYFAMDYDFLGTYTLWVTARDLAGNSVSTQAYTLTVSAQPTVYLPAVFQNYAPPVVYDFENGAGDGWSSPILETAPNGEVFLGPFNNDDLTLTLNDLPPHRAVTIAFDLYIIRSWDGNQVTWPMPDTSLRPWMVAETVGPDIWSFRVGEATLLYTTFSNWPSLGFTQAYPADYPAGDYPAQTGAAAVNTLGYTFGGMPMDATYHLEFTLPHTDSTFESGFSATGLQIGEDESWGLDNVTVTLEP